MKAPKTTEKRTVNLKIRLTPEEHELLKENMLKHGYGTLGDGGKSNYIRHCLFKKEFRVTTYDRTASEINIAIADFTKYNRIVCSNFNQVSRFIQASDVFGDADVQLEKGNKLIGEMLKYTTEVYKILAKIEYFYDIKSNPDLSNTEPSEQVMAQ